MTTPQTQTLHRALLRPFILHTLRAAGFHSTRPSVLDTLTNLTERYLLLLASTTATHARNNHNDPIPSATDVRQALQDCGALTPFASAAEEQWSEMLRLPVSAMGAAVEKGGQARETAEKRKRENEDEVDVRGFVRWFDGPAYAEIRRVAGMVPDVSAATGGAPAAAAVGVGGGLVQAEDFLTALKKKQGKAGADDARWVGTVLGQPLEERSVVLEGGPVQSIRDWRPTKVAAVEKREESIDPEQLDMELESLASSSSLSSEEQPLAAG